MAKSAQESMQVLAARDRDYFYIGYSPAPSNRELAKSVVNRKHYAPTPNEPFHNEDLSATLRYFLSNFGFTPKERINNSARFYTDAVLPQLVEAVDTEVVADTEIHVVEFETAELSLFTGVVAMDAVELKPIILEAASSK